MFLEAYSRILGCENACSTEHHQTFQTGHVHFHILLFADQKSTPPLSTQPSRKTTPARATTNAASPKSTTPAETKPTTSAETKPTTSAETKPTTSAETKPTTPAGAYEKNVQYTDYVPTSSRSFSPFA
jgi:hypothetical protein